MLFAARSSRDPSVYGEEYFCSEFADSLNGAAVTNVLPGILSAVPGQQVGTRKFKFGPALSNDFKWEYVVSIDSENSRVVGSSVFYGDDGPSKFLHASISLVPEPSAAQSLAVAVSVTATYGGWRGRRDSSK
jgi:hypothetical protein